MLKTKTEPTLDEYKYLGTQLFQWTGHLIVVYQTQLESMVDRKSRQTVVRIV